MYPYSIGQYFEEFSKGLIIKHSTSKTIFESDNNLFSLLTMNHHPVHTNSDYASKEQHGRILVVGTLVLSIDYVKQGKIGLAGQKLYESIYSPINSRRNG